MSLPRFVRFCVLSVIVAGALSGARVGTAADSLFREGDPLPDTYLRALDDGRVQSLRSLRGRKTLLIHFASW